jgi:hypothetical protein
MLLSDPLKSIQLNVTFINIKPCINKLSSSYNDTFNIKMKAYKKNVRNIKYVDIYDESVHSQK